MNRSLIIRLVMLAGAIALVVWIARHTYWADEKIDTPLRGAAARNPFYGAQRFATLLGARASWDQGLGSLPRDAVVVLSDWNWDLGARRRQQLATWVQSGGRLVVDRNLLDDSSDFTHWSGIYRDALPANNADLKPGLKRMRESCRPIRARSGLSGAGAALARSYELCGIQGRYSLRTTRAASWELSQGAELHATRVALGRGSVTAINATPFLYRGLLEGDHAALFIAATQLRRGDEVHFISEDDHASLLALAWRYGAPVMAVAMGLAALLIWRSAPRFGPLVATPERARRSLAEQILGSGQFILRLGGGDALHGALVRALGEAATRHIPGYRGLDGLQQITALAQASGYDASDLSAAVRYTGTRRGHALNNALTLLEAARRRILNARARIIHGR